VNWIDPFGLQSIIQNRTNFSSSESRPVWRQRRQGQSAPLGAQVGRSMRTGGIFCTCVWEKSGYEKIYRDSCGKIIKKEPEPSIFAPTIEVTQGVWTQSGCLCADPNGELQLR
jgi:hypothetical protein